MRKRNKTSQTGFTFIEIMIVVAIIGIGSAIAVPAYNQWTVRYELRQAIVEIASNLTMARMAARNRNTTITATFTKAVDGTYSVGFTNGVGLITFPRSVVDGNISEDTAVPPAAPAPNIFNFGACVRPRHYTNHPVQPARLESSGRCWKSTGQSHK